MSQYNISSPSGRVIVTPRRQGFVNAVNDLKNRRRAPVFTKPAAAEPPQVLQTLSSNTLHTPSNTLHTPSNTLHTPSNTLHTPSNTLHTPINNPQISSSNTPNNTLHTPNNTLSTPSNTLHNNTPEQKIPVEYPRGEIFYSKELIDGMLKNYLMVPRHLWAAIPVGSHIRYIRRENTELGRRFRCGGYVRQHWVDSSGERYIQLVNRQNLKFGGRRTYSIALKQTEVIMKKINDYIRIELELILASLEELNNS